MPLYTLLVTPTLDPADMEDGDAALVGTYAVARDGLTTAHTDEDVCTRVLDAFHEDHGIENVDDLVLTLYDHRGRVMGEAETPDRQRTTGLTVTIDFAHGSTRAPRRRRHP